MKNIWPNFARRLAADGGAGVAILTEEALSPTRDRLRAQLEKALPRMRWCQYEPLLSEAQSFGTQISFGDNTRLIPRFDRADVVLALDSDFLDCGEGDIASSRAFSSRRRVTAAKDTMNRLYVVENRYHAHRRDGGPSVALPGESDSGFHACARGQDRGRDAKTPSLVRSSPP